MPMEAYRIDRVNREFNIELKENRSIQEYSKEIQKGIEERIEKSSKDKNSDSLAREVDIAKAHEIWDNIDVSDNNVKENVKKIALSLKSSGKPDEILKLISKFEEKEELSWQNILKRMISFIVKSGYRKTITRRDRRQPDRMDLRESLQIIFLN